MDYAQCALGRGVSDLEEWQGALALAVQVTRTRVVSGWGNGDRGGRCEAGARQARGRPRAEAGGCLLRRCASHWPSLAPLAISLLAPEPRACGPTDWQGPNITSQGDKMLAAHSLGLRIMG
jgi:hypothetical protein